LRYEIGCLIDLYDSEQSISERTMLKRTGKVRTKQEHNANLLRKNHEQI